MELGKILFIARLLATVIILLLIDFEKLIVILRSIDLDFVILAVFFELAGFIVWTLKWKLLVDKLGRIGFTTLFLGLMGGNVLNTDVLRARTIGGFGRAMFLKKVTRDHGHANWYATVVMDQTVNIFVFSIPVIFSFLFVFLFLDIPRWLSILLEGITLILFILGFFAHLSRQKINRSTINMFFYSTLKRIYDFSLFKIIRNRFENYKIFEELVITGLNEFAKTYNLILKERKILLRDIGLSALMYAFIFGKAHLIFQSVSYDVSIAHLIVSLSLILWISSIIPIPGGFGIKGLIMVSIYSMVGIPLTTAAIAALIDRTIYLFFVIIIAYASIFIMRLFHIGEKNG